MTMSIQQSESQLDRAYRLLAQATVTVEGAVRDFEKARDSLREALEGRDGARALLFGLVKSLIGVTVQTLNVCAVGQLAALGQPHTLKPATTSLDGQTVTIRGWVDLTRVLGYPEFGWVVERENEPGLLAVRMADLPTPA